MEGPERFLVGYLKKNPGVQRSHGNDFVDIVMMAGERGFQTVLLEKLEKTDLSIFKYLRSLYDFLLYLQDTKFDKAELIRELSSVEMKFLALKQLKDLVVNVFSSELPLKSIIQKLLEILPMLPEPSKGIKTTNDSGLVETIAAKFGKTSEWLADKVRPLLNQQQEKSKDSPILTNSSLTNSLTGPHDPTIKAIYCRDLRLQTIAKDISRKSGQVLKEQEWLYNFQKASEHWPNELTAQLKSWNQKNPDFNLKQERVQNLYMRMVQGLIYEEIKNGLSSEGIETIRKNPEFIKSVFVNCLEICIWITRRKSAWGKIQQTIGIAEADKEICWKSISLIVDATMLAVPNSLQFFMFFYEHQILVTGLKIKDYLRVSRQYENNLQTTKIRRSMNIRTIEHVNLRIMEFNKLFSTGPLASQPSLIGYEVQILESFEYTVYQQPLLQITLDQLLICCTYSGMLLLTGRGIMTFNQILSRYNQLILKQHEVEIISPELNIIQFYNKYFLQQVVNQEKIRRAVQHPGDLELSSGFLHMLKYNDMVRE